MKVVDPQGKTWRVSRRWLPWRRRVKADSGPDLPTGSELGDDPISMIIGLVLLVLILPGLIVVGIALLELLLLLLLLPFMVLGRVIFGRAWQIEVRDGWTPVWDGEAGSWAESGQAIEAVATGLQQGLGLRAATRPVDTPGRGALP